MTATSGVNVSEPLAYYDPATSSVRTYQASLLLREDGSSTELFLTWPRWGTLSNGVLSAQPSAVPRISAVESSSWPTPKANDPEKRGDFDPTDPRTGLPGSVKLWATARSEDGERGQGSNWATPTVDDANTVTRTSGSQQSLARDSHRFSVEPWGTPNSTDGKGGSSTRTSAEDQRGELRHQIGGFDSPTGPTPSPTVGPTAPCDSSRVEPWPTPRVEPGTFSMVNGKRYETSTAKVAEQFDQQTAHQMKPKGRGLNPRFALWLMGFPTDWFDGVVVEKKRRSSGP